ncbi:MAG: hypothetical protein RIR10_1487 [Planctomycetota bacterium]
MNLRTYFMRLQLRSRCPSSVSLMALGCSLAVLVAVTMFAAYPAWMRAEARATESGRLFARASQLVMLEAERDRLREDLKSARIASDRVLREIPTESEQGSQVGALMRTLAVGASPEVENQTIVAGEPVPALLKDSRFRAIPLTVEMRASFARVMEILARAEGDRRLVRPIRIEITRPQPKSASSSGREPSEGSGFVEARLELDAVYATGDEPVAATMKEFPQ